MPRSQDSNRVPSPAELTRSQPLSNVPSPAGYHLDDFGREYWLKLAPQLVEANLLTALHLDTFAALCRTYSEYIRLSIWLEEAPERATFTISDTGYEQTAPQVTQRDKALANLQKLWPKFGLHPQSLGQMRKHGGLGTGSAKSLLDFAKSKYGPNESRNCKALNPQARGSSKPEPERNAKAGSSGSAKAKAKKPTKERSSTVATSTSDARTTG
jgi:P27 family predicted phage terminase small subunit